LGITCAAAVDVALGVEIYAAGYGAGRKIVVLGRVPVGEGLGVGALTVRG